MPRISSKRSSEVGNSGYYTRMSGYSQEPRNERGLEHMKDRFGIRRRVAANTSFFCSLRYILSGADEGTMSYFRSGILFGVMWGALADVFLLSVVLPQPDVMPGVTEPAGSYAAIAPVGFALFSVPFFASLGTYRAVSAFIPGIGGGDFFMVLVLCPLYGAIAGGVVGYLVGTMKQSKLRR
jgi:hypothetical protein